MNLEIKIAIRDAGETVGYPAIAELPRYLDNDDDAAVLRELLMLVQTAVHGTGKRATVGAVAAMIDGMDRAERREWLDGLRRMAGLPSLADLEYDRAKRLRVPDQRPLDLVVMPGGALVSRDDISDETIRQQADAASRAVQQEAKAAERAVEAEAMREHEAACAEELRRLTPPGVPVP